LSRASTPRPAIHSIAQPAKPLAHEGGLLTARLQYSHRSQSFLLARPVAVHGKSVNQMQSFTGRSGTLQARAIGLDSRGNYNTQISYGGYMFGRVGPDGYLRGGWSGNSGYSGSSGFSGGGFSGGGGGSSGGSMPSASGGPAGASGGAHR
jgi:uncharacterized membrane protein YgcG